MATQQLIEPDTHSHDPETLNFPSVPSHDPPTFLAATDGIHLPDIKSLGLPNSSPRIQTFGATPVGTASAARWQSVPAGSPVEMDTVASPDDGSRHRAASVVSMDDPDVRTAAEALTGLRSPPNRVSSTQSTGNEQEPLLQLLTSSHPWLGGTINGSMQAYEATKYYSPRVVRSIAESVERNIGSPVASTVSAVGRRTGVEGGIRRYLEHRRPSDIEQGSASGEASNKRRRLESSPEKMDIEQGFGTPIHRSRATSQASFAESLPPYDDQRSPGYEETATWPVATQPSSDAQRQPWSTQLMITTSGLGAALNDTALRNLKYCLNILKLSSQKIGEVMGALKIVIEDYEQAQQEQQAGSSSTSGEKLLGDSEREDRQRRLASRMQELGSTIWNTLQSVVEKVSKYAGGALPENAHIVVRSQLVSIPGRWGRAKAETSNQGSTEEVKHANRMIVFAKEGLDMMSQVGKVVESTIVSAEQWLERMGKRSRNEGLQSAEKQPVIAPTNQYPPEKGGNGYT